MAALQASGKCSSASGGLRFPDRPDALPLNLIWNFETTSKALNLIVPGMRQQLPGPFQIKLPGAEIRGFCKYLPQNPWSGKKVFEDKRYPPVHTFIQRQKY